MKSRNKWEQMLQNCNLQTWGSLRCSNKKYQYQSHLIQKPSITKTVFWKQTSQHTKRVYRNSSSVRVGIKMGDDAVTNWKSESAWEFAILYTGHMNAKQLPRAEPVIRGAHFCKQQLWVLNFGKPNNLHSEDPCFRVKFNFHYASSARASTAIYYCFWYFTYKNLTWINDVSTRANSQLSKKNQGSFVHFSMQLIISINFDMASQYISKLLNLLMRIPNIPRDRTKLIKPYSSTESAGLIPCYTFVNDINENHKLPKHHQSSNTMLMASTLWISNYVFDLFRLSGNVSHHNPKWFGLAATWYFTYIP